MLELVVDSRHPLHVQDTPKWYPVDHKSAQVKCPYTEKERAEAWELCATTVKNHSDEMLKRWEDEINMLLTFVCIVLVETQMFRKTDI